VSPEDLPPSFNSSLVRLKGYYVLRLRLYQPSFNSSLVRLKAGTTYSGFSSATNSFNSSLVRLKVWANTEKIVPGHRFNSSLVRLKAFRFSIARAKLTVSIPVWCD